MSHAFSNKALTIAMFLSIMVQQLYKIRGRNNESWDIKEGWGKGVTGRRPLKLES